MKFLVLILFSLVFNFDIIWACKKKPSTVINVEKNLKWWQKGIIYQVYPRSFKDSDNDGYGDLGGVTEKLDYLKSIGVNAVWLNPIYPSGGLDGGYDVTSYVDIDPLLGNMAIFDKLVDEAHKRGIYIIMDFIPNHTSDKHKWFVESRKSSDESNKYRDYYVWRKGNKTAPPNNWVSIFGGPAWTYEESRGEWYLHTFLPQQPDINIRNPVVQKEIENVIRFWMEEKKLDGLRVDALDNLFENEFFLDEPLKPGIPITANLSHPDFLHIYTQSQPETFELLIEWRKLIEKIASEQKTDKLLVVEVYNEASITMKYCVYNGVQAAYFPFNFQFIKLRNGTNLVTKEEGVPFYPEGIKSVIDPWIDNLPNSCWSNWQTGNHDNDRVGTRIGHEFIDLANVLTLLLGGTSITYYGEEIGMVNLPKDKLSFEECQDESGKKRGPELFQIYSRDYERTPMQWTNKTNNAGFMNINTSQNKKPWLPVNENYLYLNVENENQQEFSHLQIYKDLVKLKQEPSFTWGDFEYLLVTKEIFSFIRKSPGNKSYIVLMNLSNKNLTINLNSTNKVPSSISVTYVFGANSEETKELRKFYKPNESISSERILINAKNCLIVAF